MDALVMQTIADRVEIAGYPTDRSTRTIGALITTLGWKAANELLEEFAPPRGAHAAMFDWSSLLRTGTSPAHAHPSSHPLISVTSPFVMPKWNGGPQDLNHPYNLAGMFLAHGMRQEAVDILDLHDEMMRGAPASAEQASSDPRVATPYFNSLPKRPTISWTTTAWVNPIDPTEHGISPRRVRVGYDYTGHFLWFDKEAVRKAPFELHAQQIRLLAQVHRETGSVLALEIARQLATEVLRRNRYDYGWTDQIDCLQLLDGAAARNALQEVGTGVRSALHAVHPAGNFRTGLRALLKAGESTRAIFLPYLRPLSADDVVSQRSRKIVELLYRCPWDTVKPIAEDPTQRKEVLGHAARFLEKSMPEMLQKILIDHPGRTELGETPQYGSQRASWETVFERLYDSYTAAVKFRETRLDRTTERTWITDFVAVLQRYEGHASYLERSAKTLPGYEASKQAARRLDKIHKPFPVS
jgi:hypothetical protein